MLEEIYGHIKKNQEKKSKIKKKSQKKICKKVWLTDWQTQTQTLLKDASRIKNVIISVVGISTYKIHKKCSKLNFIAITIKFAQIFALQQFLLFYFLLPTNRVGLSNFQNSEKYNFSGCFIKTFIDFLFQLPFYVLDW